MLPFLTTQADAAPGQPQAPLAKVELDLEGAPFLEPDAATEVPVEALQPAAAQAEPEKPKKSRKKLFLLLALLLGGLAIIGLVVYLFFFKESAPPMPDPDVEVVVVPSTPPELPEAQLNKFNISWAPFWVEVADPEGEIRFVYCKILLVTDNQRIALQIANKESTTRDAIYYYLRHKPYSFLADLRQLDVLKSEMLNIINYYIIPETVIPPGLEPGDAPPPDSPKERLKEILIEEYLIK